MKIAIASEGNYACGHFGHCEGFTVYDCAEGKVVEKKFIPNPGHKPGFLPVFLSDLNVNVIIAGGMGERAQELFNERGIEVIVGASGLTDALSESYLRGELVSTGSVCTEHQHEGHCED